MTTSVHAHPPLHRFAGARSCRPRGQAQGRGYGLQRRHQSGDDLPFLAPGMGCARIEHEPETTSPDILDLGQAADEYVRHPERLDQIFRTVCHDSPYTPAARELAQGQCSRAIHHPALSTDARRHDEQSVNGASVAPTGEGLAQVPDQGASDDPRHGRASDNAAFRPGNLIGVLKVDPEHQPQDVVARLNLDALGKRAVDHLGLAHRRGFQSLRHHPLPNEAVT